MGLALGDYDNDGRVDTFITNFSDDSNTLRRNLGDGMFEDVTGRLRLRTPSLPFLGWGTGFLDFDNDGWLDLFVANGHVYPQVDRFDWGMTWAQRPLLFRNRDGATVRGGSGRHGIRSCGRPIGARRGFRRSRPRRPRRRRHQQPGPRPDAAQKRRHGRSLALRRPHRRCGWVARCDWRGRDARSGSAPAGGGMSSAATAIARRSDFRDALWPGRYHPRGSHRGPVAGWQSRGLHRPGVDRIVTLTKGQGRSQSP